MPHAYRNRLITTCACTIAVSAALVLPRPGTASAQAAKTVVAVVAHSDDEVAVAPILARYARAGAGVYLIVATDGAQGGAHTAIARGPELARVRAEEARCAAAALGIQPPILLGFPDAKLGDYLADPSILYRLTQRVAAELQRLRADALISWGPDGGTGHPDHRLVSNIVTQLSRAGAPEIPERLFHMYLPVEAFRALNPQRADPPYVLPQSKHFTVRIDFAPQDLEAARRAMMCHRTQYTAEIVQRVFPAQERAWNGAVTTGTDE